ncbi:MAG: F0F1 ATP synthase subunit B [Opitutales bacterium]
MLTTFYLAATEAAGTNPITEIAQRFGVDWPMLFAQVLSFLIVAFLLYRLGVKPVLVTIDERQQRISDGLRHAQEAKVKLSQAESRTQEIVKEASQEAKRMIGEAREAAKEYQDRQTKEANEKTAAMIVRAEEAIEQERRKVMAEAREEIARLVVLTSSRVLARELSQDEKTRFGESAARELQEV